MLQLLVVGALFANTLAQTPTSCEDRVSVCYFSNWAFYRVEPAKYEISDIELSTCTHLVYAFAVLDGNTFEMKIHDDWADIQLGHYRKFTALKTQKPGLKVTLAIGGWNDSRDTKYSILVASSHYRTNFITKAIVMLSEYGFDGLDLDWEYPAYDGNLADKGNFAMFVVELKAAFKPLGLLLTAAVGASEATAAAGYDIPTICEQLDFVHLMTYDMHGSWESVAQHHSPLYKPDYDVHNFYSQYTVDYWINNGCPSSKIVLGIPIYGRGFALTTTQINPPAPSQGGSTPGIYTGEDGYLSYMEICLLTGYTVVQDPQGNIGPYTYKENQWIGYDDPAMVKKKTNYALSNGLAGTMVWAIDLDDFNNVCGGGKYPLMNAIKEELFSGCNLTSVWTPAPVVTTTSTTALPGGCGNFICPSNGLWSDPCDCKAYYQCWAGSYTRYECAAGTLFSQPINNCDWEANVVCQVTTPPPAVTTPPPAVTTPPAVETTTPSSCSATFDCTANGKWPDPCDCSQYHNCFLGKDDHCSCPPGTLFNPQYRSCDWEAHVKHLC